MRILKYRLSCNPANPFRPCICRIARNARTGRARKQHPESEWTPEMSPPVVPIDSAQQQQEAALARLPALIVCRPGSSKGM